jgi:hypothetical protein
MKKFSLLLVLFLFSCQSISKKIELPQILKPSEKAIVETHRQFESRDLGVEQAQLKKVRLEVFHHRTSNQRCNQRLTCEIQF